MCNWTKFSLVATPIEFEFSKYIGREGVSVSVCIRAMIARGNLVVTMTAISGTADGTQ